jgi:hypothetical protein
MPEPTQSLRDCQLNLYLIVVKTCSMIKSYRLLKWAIRSQASKLAITIFLDLLGMFVVKNSKDLR